MNRIRTFLKKILRDTRGLAAAEWLVIAVVIIAGAAAAFGKVSSALDKKAGTFDSKLNS